jgi:DNA-binding NtrC family response regulator
MASENSTLITDRRHVRPTRSPVPALALAVVWSRTEPARVGELLLPPEDDVTFVFGRSSESDALSLVRQRPGSNVETGPLVSRGISRDQWKVRRERDRLLIENVGRRELLHNGVSTSTASARLGDLLEISDQLLMMVVSRPIELAPQRLPPALVPSFGEADEFGFVGESAAAWELRRQLAFAAGRDDHVLLTGGSGSGKEVAARAIHALSRRGAAKLVSRNAATLPDSLIDAELFGNPRDYPNPGMPERPGLIGAADGSTLFLDEIGELSHALQAHLLRVVDTGEYHRLGESRARQADIRIIAATNRDPVALKHDLLARLRLRVRLPGLDQRREDVPLIARHLLRRMACGDPQVAERAFADGDLRGEPAWTADFVAALVTATYPTNVRELHRSLWEAIGHATGTGLSFQPSDATPAPRLRSDDDTSRSGDSSESVDPQHLTAEQVTAALDAAQGSRDRAWRALGLRSRHQLLRVMRRLGISVTSQ